MVLGLLLLGGSMVVVVLIGRWLGRRLRDVDDYFERGYRDPPAFLYPDSHGSL